MKNIFTKQVALFVTSIALFIGSSNASAFSFDDYRDDSYLVLNTFTYHFKNADERNQLNAGIGFEYSPSQKLGFHVGTLIDSFNYQASYLGLNYATPHYDALGGKVRFIIGGTILNKQYHPNSEPETKLVPLPAIEFTLTEKATLNVSGSPQIDYQGQRNNAVVFFQFKLNM